MGPRRGVHTWEGLGWTETRRRNLSAGEKICKSQCDQSIHSIFSLSLHDITRRYPY